MIDRTARKRDAIGRFTSPAGVEVDVEAVRADYEANVASVAEVAIKHAISASALQRLVVRHGWTPRAPHRVNPNDLLMRMFEALDTQMRDLETTMTDAGTSHAAMLSKLVTTLDKLIEIKDAEPGKRRASKRPSKVIDTLRSKIADRIAELNEP